MILAPIHVPINAGAWAPNSIDSRSRLHIIADHHRVACMQMIVGTDIIPYLLFILLTPVVFLLGISPSLRRYHYILISSARRIDFSGVHHQVNQTSTLMIVHSVTAQKIKSKTIRHNPFRTHRATLIIVIETLIKRIIFPHIFIKTDSQ